MRGISRWAALLPALVAVLVSACSHHATYHTTPVPTVNARRLTNLYELAQRDTRCPVEALTVNRIGDRVWQASGCGETREYAIFPHGPGARWQRIAPLAARASNELACPLPQIAMGVEAQGTVAAAGCGRAASYQLECGPSRCEWVMVQHGAIPSGAGVTAPSGPASTAEAQRGEPQTIIVVPETRPSEPPLDAALRSALDAQRSAVLACGAAGIPIRARWSADGVVQLSLDPPGAGTERERCLRDSLPTYRVAAETPGEIVHVIR